jgi:hypothetical protein
MIKIKIVIKIKIKIRIKIKIKIRIKIKISMKDKLKRKHKINKLKRLLLLLNFTQELFKSFFISVSEEIIHGYCIKNKVLRLHPKKVRN